MNKAPFYTPHISRYRDRAPSDKSNKMMNELMYDITELFNQANHQNLWIDTLKEQFEVMAHYNQEHVDKLQSTIQKLQEDVTALQSPGKEYVKTYFPQDMNTDGIKDQSEIALIDKQHDIVMLPYSMYSSSKLYIHDEINNEYILPKQLKYEVQPLADGFNIRENDFSNALIPDEFKLWHRKYEYFSGLKNEVEAQIIIDVPEDIISNKDVNTIYIHPFPLNSVDIMNVEYRMNGEWKSIPGFQPTIEADNTKFCFSELEMRSVRITLRQRHYVEKSGRQVFHMGLREVSILNNDYQNGIGRFNIPVQFNETFINKEILDVKATFSNAGALSLFQEDSRLATFKIYEVNSDGSETYLSDTFPIRTTKNAVVLKGTIAFDKYTRITPTISKVEVAYKGDA